MLFGPLGALVTTWLQSAISSLAIPIVGAGLFAGGATWAVGDHKGGRSVVIAALVGGAIMLLSLTLAGGMGGVAP